MFEMEWLNLCDTGLTEDGAVLVMRATAGMTGLTTLNLSGNDLTEEAVPPLLECLRGHPTLQQLMLDDNELENDGAEAIADFFATEASVHAPSSPLDWVLPGAVVVVWLC